MVIYEARTALVVVDVQNDFADPEGSLAVAGAAGMLPRVNEEINRARGSGALTVYSQDWHPEQTPHFITEGGTWPPHCIAETWGAAFHPALHVAHGAHIIRKGTAGEDGYSVFSVRDPRSGASFPTELEGLLRDARIARVVVAGLATDYCVKETALDARRLGFAVTVLRDAIGAVDRDPGDGERALLAIADAGGEID